jgi:hypothetical protein
MNSFSLPTTSDTMGEMRMGAAFISVFPASLAGNVKSDDEGKVVSGSGRRTLSLLTTRPLPLWWVQG